MKIGIDISQIVYEGSGVGRFTNGLVRSIVKYDKQNIWTFFFSSLRRSLNPEIKTVILKSGHRLLEYKVPPSGLSFIWNRIHRMKIEKLTGTLDWFITSDWTEPPSRMKKATIIHDLVYLKFPDTVHSSIRETQKQRLKWVKKESAVIFADSRTTKKDIIENLGIPDNKIFVNYPGVEITLPEKKEILRIRKKYNLNMPFILTVGKIEPRKNIGRLIEAFKKIPDNRTPLIIVGAQGWDMNTSEKQSSTDNIRFLNYISDTELYALYSMCLFFIYPSLYEGFGYPVVEAMMAGAAVATSSNSSLGEIAQGSAFLFDPFKTDNIYKAMKTLLHDAVLRDKLGKEGIIRSQEFVWRKYVETMIQILKDKN